MVKDLMIESLEEDLKGAGQVFVTEFAGIKTSGISALRRDLRKHGTRYRVVKNSILRRVVQGSDKEALKEQVGGMCGLALSTGDVTSVSKVFVEFAKENESFKVRSVMFDAKVYGAEGVKQLAKLPGRKELLTQALIRMKSPITGFVMTLSALVRNLVNVLDQVKQQKESQV